jgi:hypothetical protein
MAARAGSWRGWGLMGEPEDEAVRVEEVLASRMEVLASVIVVSWSGRVFGQRERG